MPRVTAANTLGAVPLAGAALPQPWLQLQAPGAGGCESETKGSSGTAPGPGWALQLCLQGSSLCVWASCIPSAGHQPLRGAPTKTITCLLGALGGRPPSCGRQHSASNGTAGRWCVGRGTAGWWGVGVVLRPPEILCQWSRSKCAHASTGSPPPFLRL